MSRRQEQLLRSLEKRLGYEFQQFSLLKEAMSHSSLEGRANNERLEFLGDGVLNLVIAAYLIESFPKASEGQLSRIRAQLVCKSALAKVAVSYDVAPALILGPSEAKGGSQQRSSILADAVEAIIGAVYQDAGYQVAQTCILTWFASLLTHVSLELAAKDAKTRLQEYCQKYRYDLPDYVLLEERQQGGETCFTVDVTVKQLQLQCQGSGTSRKRAEQTAAQDILNRIANLKP